MQLYQTSYGNNSGFTLVELIIVITVMSLLGFITFGQFRTAQKKAHDVQRKGDISSVAKALESYFKDYGYYPDASSSNGGNIVINEKIVNWGEELRDGDYVYMKVLPKENFVTSLPYCYKVSTDKQKMGVFSVLENRQDTDFNALNNGNDYQCGSQNYNFLILGENSRYEDVK